MTDSAEPRMVVRDAIAAKIQGCGFGMDPVAYAEAVLGLFEVGEETWFIATVPGVHGPVDLRFQVHLPDRQPVTHTRLVLRTVPVPVEPGWRAEGAAA